MKAEEHPHTEYHKNNVLEGLIWSIVATPLVVVFMLPAFGISYGGSNRWGAIFFESYWTLALLPALNAGLSYGFRRNGDFYHNQIAYSYYQRLRLILNSMLSFCGIAYYLSYKISGFSNLRMTIIMGFFFFALIGLVLRRPRRDGQIKPYNSVKGIYRTFYWGGFWGMTLWIIPNDDAAFVSATGYFIFLLVILAMNGYSHRNDPIDENED